MRRSGLSGLAKRSLRAPARSRGARSLAFSSNKFLTDATTTPAVGERGGGGGGGSLLGVLIQEVSCFLLVKVRTRPGAGLAVGPPVGVGKLEGGLEGGEENEEERGEELSEEGEPMACIRAAALLGV